MLVFVALEEAVDWALAVVVVEGVLVEDKHWVGVEVWVGEVVAGREEGLRAGVEVPVEVTEGQEVGVEVAERVLLALRVEVGVAVTAATVADFSGETEGAELEEEVEEVDAQRVGEPCALTVELVVADTELEGVVWAEKDGTEAEAVEEAVRHMEAVVVLLSQA